MLSAPDMPCPVFQDNYSFTVRDVLTNLFKLCLSTEKQPASLVSDTRIILYHIEQDIVDVLAPK